MTMDTIRISNIDPVIVPGLKSYGSTKAQVGKLLRKPRLPRTLPPVSPQHDTQSKSRGTESTSSPNTNRNPFAEVFDMFDLKSDSGEEHYSPLPSGAPSLVSPPPSESVPTRSAYVFRSPVSNVASLVSKDEEKYVLDPLFRGRTSLGTYVDGDRLSRPFKPKGPDAFPLRAPRHFSDIMLDYDCDDIRFFQPPAFTLEHFMNVLAEKNNLPLCRVRDIMYSRHNVKKLTDLLVAEKIHPRVQTKVNLVHFDPEEKQIPQFDLRVPQRQLLLEMAALIKQHVRTHMHTDVRTVIKPAPKYSPSYHKETLPHTEILLYEDDKEVQERAMTAVKQDTEAPGTDAVIHSARSRFFQDSTVERSQSPFAPPEDGAIPPAELAVLDSLIAGGNALSLKAHFTNALPDITPMSSTLVYLNLSFNNFQSLPVEVLDLWHLEVLKLRDNPLLELPPDIDRLRYLRVLVASHCLISSLPHGLFRLTNLQHLNVAYNKLSLIPNEIKYLQRLEELDIEGNMVPALPTGILFLRLTGLRVKNNLMHPLFWKEHTRVTPQRLMDISMLTLVKYRLIPENASDVPDIVQRMIRAREVCDCCHGPRFGPGLRMIRPVPRLFGVKHLPILFLACSPTCLQAFHDMRGKQLVELLYGVALTESH